MGTDMQKDGKFTRKQFLKTSALGSAGLVAGISAKSYGRIPGASDQINVAVIGLNGRGQALISAVHAVEGMNLKYLCDVDSRVLKKSAEEVEELTGNKIKTEKDIRKLLEYKDIDAVAIATPDHWHAPMAMMAAASGKHVYVEKPCSHNPHEGELLVEAQQKYDMIIQMGNQQRSAPTSIEAIQDIRGGIIGEVYMGKAWYSNKRGPIGHGKTVQVPEWLDWELWQGPAPRTSYRDNLVHYNWHWFWNWGTGEINNNGTHEIDICRWALGVDYPTKVTSSGGRFHFDDDWEFYDTQIADFEFEGGKLITWEGKSCNPFQHHNRGRGATIHGTEGTILLDRNGYTAYNMDNEVIKSLSEKEKSATTNTVGRGNLDVLHMHNFAETIRGKAGQHSPIEEGHKSNLLCHLGNIAQENGGALQTDPSSGTILDNPEAMEMWQRDYENGWELEV